VPARRFRARWLHRLLAIIVIGYAAIVLFYYVA